MLQHLTPTTLKEMYRDLDEARLDLMQNVDPNNMASSIVEYHQLTEYLEQLDAQYEAITGEMLWAEIATENA